MVERHQLPEDQPQYVLFLDLRQLAQNIKYMVLARRNLLREELQDIVCIRPPPGWRLRIAGGRMRRNRLEFQPSATLVFGLQYAADSDESEDYFSPTTDADGQDSEDEESSDGGQDGDDISQATTRSRSCRRHQRELCKSSEGPVL